MVTIIRILESIDALPYTGKLLYKGKFHKNHPFQHCVWNCRMAKEKGEKYAKKMSEKKEALDRAVAALGRNMDDECWDKLPNWLKKKISDFADSADQPSDFRDNAAGRTCGLNNYCGYKSCEECYEKAMGIGPETLEGPGTERPYGPYQLPEERRPLYD